MDSTNRSPDDPYERGVRHGRRLGSFAALTTVRRAIRQASPTQVAGVLNGLVSVDDLGLVLRQLEDLADKAGEHS